MTTTFQPFQVALPDGAVDDLRRRLHATRWPDELPDVGWDYGTPLARARELCAQWAEHDVDAFLDRCNRYPQVVGEVDGVRLHLVHARSPHPQARPLVLVHGWPGSIVEFFDVIGPLVDPVVHGGDAADAFHVIAPSLPGYGFSGPTTRRGIDAATIARLIAQAVGDLGYEQWFVQGGDWGSLIGAELARQFPDRVRAVHLTLLNAPAPPREVREEGLSDSDRDDLAAMLHFRQRETGYQAIQSTKPQTLAYGLHDSPAGLAAWIGEKFHTWTDRQPGARGVPTERLLDNLCVYWFTGTIGSSMRLYYETLGVAARAVPTPITVPVGHARYPGEIYKVPRAWAERSLPIAHWATMPRGGHFPSLEVPDLFVPDLREFFRAYR